MKLLKEADFEEVECIIEAAKSGGEKNFFIEGIFMQTESKNRNGRIYPRKVIEEQVGNYQKSINEKRSLGELGHPDTPSLNFDRVSHLITSLKMEGNNTIGKAKILDTPMGKITKSLIGEGVRLGVSSRGLGSIKEKNGAKMVESYILTTVDIVHEPSAPEAYVDNILEHIQERVEWFFDGESWVKQEAAYNIVEEYKQQKKLVREQEFLKLFERLFK